MGVAHMPCWANIEKRPMNAPQCDVPSGTCGFAPHAVTTGGLAAGLASHNAHADVSGT